MSSSISIHVIVNYIDKYCSKTEKKSVFYKELLDTVISLINNLYALISIINKFLNKLIDEWDWSVQEIYYLLLDLSLSNESRIMIILNCHQKCDQTVLLEFQNDEITQKKSSYYNKYKNWSQDKENISFHEFLIYYNFNFYKLRSWVKSQIISYFLRYKSDSLNINYSNFCHMKLLLHHLFQECENVATMINESEASSYIYIYNECHWLHTHSDDHMTNSELNDNENMNADDDNKFENQKSVDIEFY